MLKCSIITIGDELLIGQVVDTNSAWMARQLNSYGLPVRKRVAVGDSRDEIRKALDEEGRDSDFILITGGLGPTADDITKPLLCEYFGGKLKVDADSLANVKYLFEEVFRRPLTDRNLKQAEVPDNCKVIINSRGTAPGMVFEKEGKTFISMPGVPHEMQGMMTKDVIPLMLSKGNNHHIVHKTLVSFGIGESMLADHISDFENSLPPNIKLAYLPNYGMVRLRLTGTGNDQPRLVTEVENLALELSEHIKEWLISNEDEGMENIIYRLLKTNELTLSTAESCTGGYISHLITAIAGSSAVFKGGVVSYSNDLKRDILEVKEETLRSFGAVSEETVSEMLHGIRKQSGTDYGLAVSGVMGPGGGSEDKPVGTVWIGVINKKDEKHVRKFQFRFDRQRNIHMTAINALNLLRSVIVEDIKTD